MTQRGGWRHWLWFLVILTGFIVPACASRGGGASHHAGDDVSDDSGGDDVAGDDTGPYYDPTWAVPTSVIGDIRGRHVIRGPIHCHSWYSHDACDNKPVGNFECLMQMRDAFCATRQNFVMLTDHSSYFADRSVPDSRVSSRIGESAARNQRKR